MKNLNSTMLENYEEFVSLTLRTRNSKRPSRMARKKLETPVAPAMPCKISKNSQNWVTRGKSNEIKSKLACILEASESTRLRMGESLSNHHEDHIAGKGDNALQHHILVHKIYSCASSHENSCNKGSSGQGMGNIGQYFGVEPDESHK